jgi:signal peptidase
VASPERPISGAFTISTSLRSLARIVAALQIAAVVVLLGAIALVLVGVGPTFFGYETLTVLSVSMEPNIHVGSLAVVKGVPTDQLQPGDIITYRTPSQPNVVITHRLLKATKKDDGSYTFETKGDANNVADLVAVDPATVLGRVVYSVPYAGYVGDFAKKPEGVVIFLGLPGLLLGLDFARDRLRGRRQSATAASAALTADAAAQRDGAQIAELLTLGRQAEAAGHHELAAQAADKVIQLDPRNEDAWILKADCARTEEERTSTLRAAAMINPSATRVAALLQSVGQQG